MNELNPSPARRRRLAWALGGTVLAAVTMTAVTAVAVRAADKAATAPVAATTAVATAAATARPALTVTVTQPRRETLALAVAANGNIAAWQEAVVGAEAPGLRLAEVRVNVGDRVRRGQVLAVFDSALAQADLAASRASVAEAEATLAEAQANAQRARELGPQGVISAQQVNQLLTAERTAAARLEAQRAALRVQTLRLAQAQVLAPDEGVISARSATVGAVVPAGQEMFRLIRQSRLEWRAEVAAADLARLQPGQAVRVLPAGAPPGSPAIAGRVRMLAPTVDAATRNGLVYVDLPAPGAARAGMFARGEFEVGSAPALTLPQGAVLLRDGFSHVFQVGADNRVRQAKVSVGRRVGDRVEITAGLDPQARVVAEGAGFLGDGDTVRVVEAVPPATPGPATAASAR